MKTNKKKRVLILGSIAIILLLIGIGGKIYMDNQAKQEQLRKNLAESKKEIIELLEWNYNDIHSVTFDYDGGAGSGVIKVSFDKSLTTTPVGILTINGWVNGDRKLSFDGELNTEMSKIVGGVGNYGGDLGLMAKDLNNVLWSKTVTANRDGKLSDEEFQKIADKVQNSPSYYLDIEDIHKLKRQGFNKNITSEQIVDYVEGGRK